jgi:WD40 repeat protein
VEKDDTLTKKHCLQGHQKPISFVAWSPNDRMLLTCGTGESLKLWNVNTGECNLKFGGSVDYIINSCAWFPNSEKIVCASSEPGSSPNRIFTCNLEGQELEVWAGDRIPKVSGSENFQRGGNGDFVRSRQFHPFLFQVMDNHSLSTLTARKFICGKLMKNLLCLKSSRGTSKRSLWLGLALGVQIPCSLLVAVRIHRYSFLLDFGPAFDEIFSRLQLLF